MANKIYIVEARDTDRNRVLGHAIGEIEDIRAFFADRQGYGLEIKELVPVVVTKGFATMRAKLLAEKAELETKVRDINTVLRDATKGTN